MQPGSRVCRYPLSHGRYCRYHTEDISWTAFQERGKRFIFESANLPRTLDEIWKKREENESEAFFTSPQSTANHLERTQNVDGES